MIPETITRFFETLRPEDMRWFLPLATGGVIVLVALLAAIVRGFTFANFLALALGCALAGSSLIGRLAFGREDVATATVAIARSVALSEANARAIGELRGAVTTLEQVLSDLPVPRTLPPAPGGEDPADRLRKAQTSVRDAVTAVDRIQREAAEQRRQADEALKRLDALTAPPR